MKRLLILVAAVVAAASCAAEPADPGSVAASSSTVQLMDLGFHLDGAVAENVWREAPAGCEGRIDEYDLVDRVARAENAPGLAVVVTHGGVPLCVDSLESIALELMKLQGDPSPDPMYPKVLH